MSGDPILIIEDDDPVRTLLTELLSGAGYTTTGASDGPQAVELAKKSRFHLYLIDLRLPGMSGLDVMSEIRKIHPDAVCILLTAYGTIELSVKAIKIGAYNFIVKPFKMDAVLSLVRDALSYSRSKREQSNPEKVVRKEYRFGNQDDIVGASPLMEQVYDLIEKVLESDSTILIQGESGTGKEVAAKTIHYNSPRKDKPLIPVNCGAIPESLLESELFGHEKGAFTGAAASRLGRFELAHGGTLFLDEIGEMPLPLQVKLLRVLQERAFERVGGTKTIHVDVRIIAATNQDLEQAVVEKRFRKDLFYRLNVIPINIPALRERKEDIPLLVHHFIHKFNEKKQRKIEGISPEAQKLLIEYSWPGNIRELENLIERLVTLKEEGLITIEDLPAKLTKLHGNDLQFKFDLPEEGANFFELVTEFENQLLQQALSKANGVKNRAAQLLQMNRTTLVEKLKKRWSAENAENPEYHSFTANH